LSESPAAPPLPPPPPSATLSAGPSGPRATFWQRFVALFVDGLIIGGVQYGIGLTIDPDVGFGVGLVFGLVYYSYLEGSPSGQTVGKKVMGIRVVDFKSGHPIGFGRGLVRWVGRLLSGLACGLGYLWKRWDREKHCWQHKLATTFVVPV
jgi:uncharacterized RDD family membrane protein YckC